MPTKQSDTSLKHPPKSTTKLNLFVMHQTHQAEIFQVFLGFEDGNPGQPSSPLRDFQKWKFSLFHQIRALSMNFRIFRVTYRVANILAQSTQHARTQIRTQTLIHTHRFHLLCVALRVLCGWGYHYFHDLICVFRKSVLSNCHLTPPPLSICTKNWT